MLTPAEIKQVTQIILKLENHDVLSNEEDDVAARCIRAVLEAAKEEDWRWADVSGVAALVFERGPDFFQRAIRGDEE